MNDLTYACSGIYNSETKCLDFEIQIPKPETENPYIFYPFYNISKKIEKIPTDREKSEKHKNVILIFLKKKFDDGQLLLKDDNNLYSDKIDMNYKSVFEHIKIKEFDMSLDEKPMLIIIHNNLFEFEIVASIFDNLQIYYDNLYINKKTEMPLYNFPNAKGGPKLIGAGDIR